VRPLPRQIHPRNRSSVPARRQGEPRQSAQQKCAQMRHMLNGRHATHAYTGNVQRQAHATTAQAAQQPRHNRGPAPDYEDNAAACREQAQPLLRPEPIYVPSAATLSVCAEAVRVGKRVECRCGRVGAGV